MDTRGGSVAEWSTCWTRNPAVQGSYPALGTQNSALLVMNSQLVASCQWGFSIILWSI